MHSHLNKELQAALGPGSRSGLNEHDLGDIHRSPMTSLSLPQPIRERIKVVYLEAFTDQMLAMTTVAAIAFVVSLGTYRATPAPIVEAMAYHKQLIARSIKTELESTSSIRTLKRKESP